MRGIATSIAIVIVALCGYFGVQYYKRASDPLVAGIPPHENPDGTVDYTLVDRWVTDKEPYYWIIRLPKDQHVTTSENWSGRYSDSQVNVGFKTRSNQYITLFFNDVALKDYVKVDEFSKLKSAPDNFEITIRSEESLGRSDFEDNERFLNDVVRKCAPLEKIAPGVDRFPHVLLYPNDEIGSPKCKQPILGSSGLPNSYVSVRRDDGNPVGYLTCAEWKDMKVSGSCIGHFLFGEMRSVNVTVPLELLPRIGEIYRALDLYLKQVTVRVDMSEFRKSSLASEKEHQEREKMILKKLQKLLQK